MREDIITALRNATERGESLEQAGLTLINAGYNPQEVNESIQHFVNPTQFSSIQVPSPPKQNNSPPVFKQTQETQKINYQQTLQQPKQNKKSEGLLIALGSILFFLLVVLIISFIFKDKIISFLS